MRNPERAERRACIRFALHMLRTMSTPKLRKALVALMRIYP